MAHQAHNIPWNTFAANFDYIYQNPHCSGVTNLYPRFKPTQGQELNYFVEAFVRTIEEHSTCERRKYADEYARPSDDDVIVSDAVALKVAATMHRVRRALVRQRAPMKWMENVRDTRTLCQHPDEDREVEECTCPLPYRERKASAFNRSYQWNSCYEFFLDNEDGFFNLELTKALILYGDMEPILRAATLPDRDINKWWSVSQCQCSDYDVGWEHPPKMALQAYICLNVLYCKPELWDAASGGKTEQRDYRHTKCFQRMVRACTVTEMTSEIATFPHRQFLGIADDQFWSWPRIRKNCRWNHLGEGKELRKNYPFGKMPLEEFLALESIPEYQPHANDVRHVRWLLTEKGLPVELAMDIMEAADYTPKRRLDPPNDPFHPDNSDVLKKYLLHCWLTLIRCDMVAKASGDRIPWAKLVSHCVITLFSPPPHKDHKSYANNKRDFFKAEDMTEEEYSRQDINAQESRLCVFL